MEANQEFNKLCIEAIKLLQFERILDDNEGSIQQEGKYIFRKKGFSYKIRMLIDIIFDTFPEIKDNYSVDSMQDKLELFFYNLFINQPIEIDKEIDIFLKTIMGDIKKEITTFIIPRLIE